jgi:hypothetical protein
MYGDMGTSRFRPLSAANFPDNILDDSINLSVI